MLVLMLRKNPWWTELGGGRFEQNLYPGDYEQAFSVEVDNGGRI